MNQALITDFKFTKVSLDVNFRNGSECIYYLLIDEDFRIHDYKFHWKKVVINQATTASHKDENTFRINFRKNILKEAGIDHVWSTKKQSGTTNNKKNIILNEHQIGIFNREFKEWKNETFQNIIYVLTGSNASGEGKPENAAAFTWIGDKKYAVGFLLQGLNISKSADCKRFKNLDKYEEYPWKNLDSENELPFSSWIKTNQEIFKNFQKFNSYENFNEWKHDLKRMKNFFSTLNLRAEELTNKIKKLRGEFDKNVLGTYDNIVKMANDVWQSSFSDVEKAHIKPVWLIKEEYLHSNENEKILWQICDKNNCLLLTPSMHTSYDKNKILWNTSGELMKKEAIKSTDLPDGYKKFLKIPVDYINVEKKRYINEYIMAIKKRNKSPFPFEKI